MVLPGAWEKARQSEAAAADRPAARPGTKKRKGADRASQPVPPPRYARHAHNSPENLYECLAARLPGSTEKSGRSPERPLTRKVDPFFRICHSSWGEVVAMVCRLFFERGERC